MKSLLSFIFITCLNAIALAQSTPSSLVNNSNYYTMVEDTKGYSINWLRSSDAVPVIIDQLIKKGIAYYTISIGDLININDSTRFVVTVSFAKAGKDFGIIYEPSHSLPLMVKDRDYLNAGTKPNYVQVEQSRTGENKVMRIRPLPDNIFVLKETCYWFQFDNAGTKFKVSKQTIEDILRQDINEILEKL